MRFKAVKPAQHLTVIGICLVVFAVCLFLTLRRVPIGLETEIFSLIYGWSSNFKQLFWLITQLGGLWMFIAAVLVFFWQRKNSVAFKLLLSGAAAFLAVQLLKGLVGRPRPLELIDGVITRENFAPGFGFPSGHAAIATVIALCIVPYLKKRYRPLAYSVIILVPLSRIYLGVHLPLDVVGGVAIGVIMVKTYELIVLKLGIEKPKKRA